MLDPLFWYFCEGIQAYGLPWNLFGQCAYSKICHWRSWCLNTWLTGLPRGYGHGECTGYITLDFFCVMRRTLHFAGWNSICHSSSHFSSLFRSSSSFSQSSTAVTVTYTIVSSANRRTWECLVYCGMSFMKIRKRIGPKTSPCKHVHVHLQLIDILTFCLDHYILVLVLRGVFLH